MINTNNFCVKITHLKGMLKRVQKIKVSLMIPEIFKTSYAEIKSVYLSIRDEDNNPVNGWIKNTIVKGKYNKDLLTEVHRTKLVDFYKNPQEVEFEFISPEKLLPGTYTAQMYTTDEYIGSVDFRIKRFWLF